MSSTEASAGRASVPSRGRTLWKRLVSIGAAHLVLTLLGLALILPFIWMVLTSFKRIEEVGLETWFPAEFMFSNYSKVFTTEGIQFARWYCNSVFVASWATFLQVFTSALAAFSFARLRWPGRDKVFLLYLATMMLPALVMMIPNYQIIIELGLVDSYAGLIVPHPSAPSGLSFCASSC